MNSTDTSEGFTSIIEEQLPPSLPTRMRSGVDYYGLSSVLAKRCGRSSVPRSFANWVHGWVFNENPTPVHLSCATLPREMKIVVRNINEKLAMNAAGFTDVIVGGLPFAYVNRQCRHRLPNSLLAFPPHSSAGEYERADQCQYLDYLESLRQDFDSIYLSIYHLDVGSPLYKAAQSRGIRVLQGARLDDANSLLRTRHSLDLFTHVTSNVIGSHMLYALYAGCKFSFAGPMHTFDPSILLDNIKAHKYSSEYIQSVVSSSSEPYLRQRFGRFFVNHPSMGLQDVDFAKDEIGFKSILSLDEIEDALGWRLLGQINGYASSAKRRLIRNVKIFSSIA